MRRATPILALLAFSVGLLCRADEPGETPLGKLRAEYAKAKLAELTTLNKRYVAQVESLFTILNAGNDLKNARRAEDFFKRLRDPDLANDLEGLKNAPADTDQVGQLQSRYAKERGEALLRLNTAYVEKTKALQLAPDDAKGANEAVAFLKVLTPETAGAGAAGGKTIEALLAPANAEKWKIEKGEWTTAGDTLTGSGDSATVFLEKQTLPFTLRFKIKVVSGMRPRVQVGEVTFANEGYEKIFLLYPIEQPSVAFPYRHNVEYNIAIAVSEKSVELSVNDKPTAKSRGIKKPIEKIRFSGGDWWSKGKVEYREIGIER